jgi:hypothetical protein
MTATVNVIINGYHKQKLIFDVIDLEIVRLLDQDIKTKHLTFNIGITISVIEKRKAR